MAQPVPAHPSRAPRARWIGIATALMSALAGGAVWCLLALYARRDLIVLALPVALFVVWPLRANGFAGRWVGALVAAACVVLACAYSLYLQAVAQVASMLGLPMRDALLQMDPGMAADIAWANLDFGGASIMLVAVLIAVCATLAVTSRPESL
jgi:hypothetical protein